MKKCKWVLDNDSWSAMTECGSEIDISPDEVTGEAEGTTPFKFCPYCCKEIEVA